MTNSYGGKKMKNSCYKKFIVYGIIVLFFGIAIIPSLNAESYKTNISEPKIMSQDTTSLTFYTFDKTGKKQFNAVLPLDDANNIYRMLEELKYKIIVEPYSEATQALENEFINLLDENGLITGSINKADVHALLNPSLDYNKIGPIVSRLLNLLSRIPAPGGAGSAFMCSVGSAGKGFSLPFEMVLPRPHAFVLWFASNSVTSVGELMSNEGFIAYGKQNGFAIGFTGVGLTYSPPGETLYGFIGNAFFTRVIAESFEYFPENLPPTVSAVSPANGAINIPISTNELKFSITDPNGDLMRYTVTTDPDIGDGEGIAKPDGTYSIPISGLEASTAYTWTVKVTDGKNEIERQFSFFTELLPFDPFDEGWQYRKKVTIDHSQVDGDFTGFPVLISTVDSDLRDKAQSDGDDVLFMTGTGVANKLFHEIEYFDSSNGELVAWINVPSLSNAVDTIFYMYYGNPGCNNQQLSEGVWDSNYIAVWHLKESSGTRYDSTSNNRDLSPNGDPTSTIGKIGSANDFDGTDDRLDLGYECNLGSEHSATFWLKIDTYRTFTTILGYSGSEYVAEMANSHKRIAYTNGYEDEGMHCNAKDWQSNWYYCAVVRDDGDGAWYLNGVDETYQSTIATSWDMPIRYIAGHGDPDQRLDGYLDEVRISNKALSQQWISTEYNNQNDPSSFFSVGPEVTSP